MKKLLLIFSSYLLFQSLSAQVVQNGLVAHFRLDGNADDVSPLNMDGIATGTTSTIGKNGGANTALLFVPASMSGINAGVNNRNITNQVTMSAWIKTTASGTQKIIDKYDFGNDGGYYLEVYMNKAIIGGRDGGGNFIYPGLGTTTVNDGQWHHVMGIVDGNIWQIWVDCNLENADTTSTVNPNITCTYPLVIGYSYHGTTIADPRYFDGTIDEVRIYNRVLNAQEIDSICAITEPFIGLDEYGMDIDFTVFPNPATDFIMLSDFEKTEFTVSIYNSLGQLVSSTQNNLQIDVSFLAAGSYSLIVTDNNNILVGKRKLLIQ